MPNNIIMADPKGGDPYEVARKLVDKSITEYVDPNIEFIGATAFANCPNLKTIQCHGTKVISDRMGQVFNLNTTLTSGLAFPNLIAIGTNGPLQYCKTPSIDLGKTYNSSIMGYFMTDSTATILILRSPSVVPLNHIGSLPTPFQSGKSGGTLYVPSDLISSYQSASNWSTILGYPNNRIEAIEGSIYETQYADGTPIPTGG